jgi:sugar phosphate isomerase/epimerase
MQPPTARLPFPMATIFCPKIVSATATAVKSAKGYDWAPMGGGIIDWAGQFKALKRDGYHYAVSLKTHWHGEGSPEESSRQSWAGMKKLLREADAL